MYMLEPNLSIRWDEEITLHETLPEWFPPDTRIFIVQLVPIAPPPESMLTPLTPKGLHTTTNWLTVAVMESYPTQQSQDIPLVGWVATSPDTKAHIGYLMLDKVPPGQWVYMLLHRNAGYKHMIKGAL